MEVKDFGTKIVTQEAATRHSFQRSVSAIPSVKVANASEESVKVDVESSQQNSHETPDLRMKLNQIMNVVNVTSEATESIRKLVNSIDGISKQVSEGKQPENRVAVLEREANGLVEEIQNIADNTSVNGIKPLYGDKMVFEVRARLGKVLDIVFPSDASNAFGIGTISFSRKEAIIETRAKIERAMQNMEELRKSVRANSQAVEITAASLEVAMQNSKASEASPRDLDAAIELANETSLGIGNNPESAMQSVGKMPNVVKTLLE